MKSVDEFRRRAEHYRQMKWQITDPAALQAICDLAGEAQMTAEEPERRHSIRDRAHEIWIERGRSAGRDVEFGLAAERALDSRHELPRRGT